MQRFNRVVHGANGTLLELADAHVAIARFQQFETHASHFNNSAGEFHHNRFAHVFARQGQRDGGAGLAAHFFHCFADGHAAGRHIVDFHNIVATFDTGALGRSVFNRRHHFHKAVFSTDFHTQAAEFAAGGLFQVGIVFLVHEFRMRIQAGNHAFYGIFQQFVVGFVLVVVGFNLAVHFCHGTDGLYRQCVFIGVFLSGHALYANAEGDAAEGAEGIEGYFFQSRVCH